MNALRALFQRHYLSFTSNQRLLDVVGISGLLLCLLLSYFSSGSNDQSTWLRFAQNIQNTGVFPLYLIDASFNHPPIGAMIVYLSYLLSELSDLPFPFLLRLPSVLCHILIALLIRQYWYRKEGGLSASRAFAAYSSGSAAILISGFHGNTDFLCLTALLLSFIFADRQRPVISGLLFGLSFNIKLLALICAPALLFAQKNLKAGLQTFSCLLFCATPFAISGILGGGAFIDNVIGYKPFIDYWGIQLLLSIIAPLFPSTYLGDSYAHIGAYLILILAFALSATAKNQNPYLLASISLLLFLLLASGFGIQYLVYPIPFLFILRLDLAFYYVHLAGLFLICVYSSFMVDWQHLSSVHDSEIGPSARLLGIFLWLFILYCLKQLKGLSGARISQTTGVRIYKD